MAPCQPLCQQSAGEHPFGTLHTALAPAFNTHQWEKIDRTECGLRKRHSSDVVTEQEKLVCQYILVKHPQEVTET